MNVVTFPGLNLSFEVSKVAFTIFGISIYKYAVCIVLGIVLALILCKLAKQKFDVKYNDVLVCTVLGIIFGTIGARLYYIIFNLDYYSQNVSEIFNFRNGGLAIYGGLIIGAIAIYIYCKVKKLNVLNFFDYVIPYVAIAQCVGRIGNFFNVEAYGVQTTSIVRMGIKTIEGYMEVHPVFFYECIATLLIFVILKILQNHRKFEGQIITLYCLLYSGIRFFLEGIRADSLMMFNFRASQVVSLIVFVISLVVLIINVKKLKKVSKEENKAEMKEKI